MQTAVEGLATDAEQHGGKALVMIGAAHGLLHQENIGLLEGRKAARDGQAWPLGKARGHRLDTGAIPAHYLLEAVHSQDAPNPVLSHGIKDQGSQFADIAGKIIKREEGEQLPGDAWRGASQGLGRLVDKVLEQERQVVQAFAQRGSSMGWLESRK